MGWFSLPKQAPRRRNSVITAKAFKQMSRVQTKLFIWTNGRIGSKWRVGAGFRKPVPTLLLEHRGRKSGRVFITPLLYLDDGGALVIVGSQGGLPKHPAWYHNLRANPDARVHVKGRHGVSVRARVADDEERAALWPRLVELYADFAKYQARTEREIPVVVLELANPS